MLIWRFVPLYKNIHYTKATAEERRLTWIHHSVNTIGALFGVCFEMGEDKCSRNADTTSKQSDR